MKGFMVRKMNLKKKLMILLSVGIVLFAASPLALADNENNQASSPVTTVQTMELTNSKYLTKGGAAFWFIFTIVINGALSFWIGNRFYRLAKKENHVGAELRALRRDIDDKFVKNVDGFAEQEIEIENINDLFAMKEETIKPVKQQPSVKDLSPEEEERFRQWEAAQLKTKPEHVKQQAERSEEREGYDFDYVKKVKRKHYQPQRDEEEDNSQNFDETRVIKPVGEGVKNKAKEILSDIFPFKDE